MPIEAWTSDSWSQDVNFVHAVYMYIMLIAMNNGLSVDFRVGWHSHVGRHMLESHTSSHKASSHLAYHLGQHLYSSINYRPTESLSVEKNPRNHVFVHHKWVISWLTKCLEGGIRRLTITASSPHCLLSNLTPMFIQADSNTDGQLTEMWSGSLRGMYTSCLAHHQAATPQWKTTRFPTPYATSKNTSLFLILLPKRVACVTCPSFQIDLFSVIFIFTHVYHVLNWPPPPRATELSPLNQNIQRITDTHKSTKDRKLFHWYITLANHQDILIQLPERVYKVLQFHRTC